MAEIATNTVAETQVENNVENTQQGTEQQTETTTTATTTEATSTETENTVIGAEATTTETAKAETTTQTETVKVEPTKKTFEELAKEFGFENELEILNEAKAQKQKQKEEEEKPYSEAKEWAELISFSAKNKLADSNDFIEHKKINAEKNETLAFNKFKAEFVAPEGADALEPSELQELIVEQFNEKYFIGSDNPTLQKTGEKLLEEVANEVRKPINEKILTAQNRFATTAMYQQHQTALNEFNKTAQTVSAVVKDADGKEETISFEVTPELTQAEVDTYLKSEEGNEVLNLIFKSFTASREAGDKGYGAVLTHLHQQKVQDKIIQQGIQLGYEKGLEAGKALGVGAKAPFNSKENSTQSVEAKDEPVRQFKSTKYS